MRVRKKRIRSMGKISLTARHCTELSTVHLEKNACGYQRNKSHHCNNTQSEVKSGGRAVEIPLCHWEIHHDHCKLNYSMYVIVIVLTEYAVSN